MKLPPIAINNLLHADIGVTQDYGNISEEVHNLQEDDPTIIAPLTFQLRLIRGENSIDAEFKDFKTKVSLSCNRCNDTIEKKIHLPLFSETYFIQQKQEDDNEIEEHSTVDLKTNSIDITKTVRDEISLAIDTYELCSINCKGFCSTCGKNQNKEKCICMSKKEVKQENKPFVSLKRMFQQNEEE